MKSLTGSRAACIAIVAAATAMAPHLTRSKSARNTAFQAEVGEPTVARAVKAVTLTRVTAGENLELPSLQTRDLSRAVF